MSNTTVSVLGKDGEPVVTVPLDFVAGQLSFDVGQGPDEIACPRLSTFGISGKLTSFDEELLREDQVIVTIATPDGEVMARKLGMVTAVSFITHESPDGGKWVERAHKVKVA